MLRMQDPSSETDLSSSTRNTCKNSHLSRDTNWRSSRGAGHVLGS